MKPQRAVYKRGRTLRTRRSTRLVDGTARALITVGGLGTIIAVCAVFVFLFVVVKDLFLPARVGEALRPNVAKFTSRVLDAGLDEYRIIAWTLSADGLVRAVSARDGSAVAELPVRDGDHVLTAYSREPDGTSMVLGFADGSVRLAEVRFLTEFFEMDAVGDDLHALDLGEIAPMRGGLVERTASGQFRLQTLSLHLEEPKPFADGSAITAVARSTRGNETVVAAVSGDAAQGVKLRCARRTIVEDIFGGDPEAEWSELQTIPTTAGRAAPQFVQLTDLGMNLVFAWRDGMLERFVLRDSAQPQLAETLDLAPEPNIELSSLGLLLGGVTLIAGRSDGRVSGWFVAASPTNEVDGFSLAEAHRFETSELSVGGTSAVISIATSNRERIFAVGTLDGRALAMYMTSGKQLADFVVRDREAVQAIAIAPKSDALLTVTQKGMAVRSFQPRHPEASLGALFGKTWYERRPGPEYAWQSSGGTDDFEPKLSLMPLIFGTLKATIYSMLLAVPLAILAAIYTSEFLSARRKARIKPIVELMASLPSVVLGFLAAIVIAPAVESIVPQFLTALFTVPVAMLFAAHVWQTLPSEVSVRRGHWRMPLAFVALLVGCCAAAWLGPHVEASLFAGDLPRWLDGRAPSVADGQWGWLPALLPCAALLVAWFITSRVNPIVARHTSRFTHSRAGLVHLSKFVVGVIATLCVAVLLQKLIYQFPVWFLGEGSQPFDLRNGITFADVNWSPLGTFNQRNSLIVGFVMGFAVIPIIYTIAEDALSSVPEHLRAASLGCGATPWQTAVRVIVPTAMSGLFSACMIGLGRAVGETMIVLMAAGGTAVMDMNAFGGFRTLSANIATELPEAVRDSTHYRTLFLSALVLLSVTFVINTIAESVRQRFRRRAYQL